MANPPSEDRRPCGEKYGIAVELPYGREFRLYLWDSVLVDGRRVRDFELVLVGGGASANSAAVTCEQLLAIRKVIDSGLLKFGELELEDSSASDSAAG